MEQLLVLFLTADSELVNFCRVPFSDAGCQLSGAGGWKDAARVTRSGMPAAVIVDCAAKTSVFGQVPPEEYLAKARQSFPAAVIVAVLEEGATPQKVLSLLQSYVNEVAVRPLRPRVFAEQIKALVRLRERKKPAPARKMLSGAMELSMDVPGRRCYFKVKKEGQPQPTQVEISLTRSEFSILRVLLENKHKLVSYDDFKQRLWPGKAYSREIMHTLAVHMASIRRKLEGSAIKIDNLWGEGFRLD
ncbi:MAG: winged helix-turn-helix domain-containing protein [Elusimicrobiales bacterium]